MNNKELKDEVWKDIDLAPGYQISNFGRVKRIPRRIYNGHGYYVCKEKILKGSENTNGYIQVDFRVNKERRLFMIHRLVAFAFLKNVDPIKYTQINHIDGNKKNNFVGNLEWCDNSLNQIHAYKTGLNKRADEAGKPKKPVILTSKDGKEIRFNSVSEASSFLGIYRNINLLKVLKGVKYYYTVKGYKARYDD